MKQYFYFIINSDCLCSEILPPKLSTAETNPIAFSHKSLLVHSTNLTPYILSPPLLLSQDLFPLLCTLVHIDSSATHSYLWPLLFPYS